MTHCPSSHALKWHNQNLNPKSRIIFFVFLQHAAFLNEDSSVKTDSDRTVSLGLNQYFAYSHLILEFYELARLTSFPHFFICTRWY